MFFFVEAEWKKNSEVFKNYHPKIQTMPSIIVIASTTKKGSQFKFQDKDKIPLQSDVTAESMARQINDRLDKSLPKIVPPEPSYLKLYLMGAACGVIILWIAYFFRKSTTFWTALALLVPWFTYTGAFFNLNMGVPFTYMHPSNQQMVIIWPSQQMQTILEGLLVASLIILLGLCCGLLATLIPSLPYSRRRLSFWLLFIVIGGLLYLYKRIWNLKTSWYLVYS